MFESYGWGERSWKVWERVRKRGRRKSARDNGSKDVLWRPTLVRLPTLNGVRGLKSCPNKKCKKVWKCEKERQTKDKGCVVATNFGKIAKPPTLSSDSHNNCSTTICSIVIPSLSFQNIPIFSFALTTFQSCHYLLFQNISINLSVILWQFFLANRHFRISCMKVIEKKMWLESGRESICRSMWVISLS